MSTAIKQRSPAQRFVALVHGEPGLFDCWIWAGRLESNGYGKFRLDGGPVWSHRAAWRLFRGPIPPGFDVCHDCPGGDRRDCVNPSHLFIGTRADNMADAVAKGRTTRGARNPAAKVSADLIPQIRAASGFNREIGAMFGMSESGIRSIKKRRTWAHV